MSDGSIFINDQYIWPILIGAIVLFGVFIWKELTSSSGKKLIFKLVLSVIALVCLVLLLLKPTMVEILQKGLAVMVTTNHKEKQLDSLLDVHKELKIIEYEKSRPFQKKLDSVNTLFVVGEGIAPFDFWQTKGVAVKYLGGEPIEGITRLKYGNSGFVGSNLKVSLAYQNPSKGNRLLLEDPAGIGIDSVDFEGNREERINLLADLRVAGRFVYSLVEKDSAGVVISREPLPVVVRKSEVLKILIINDFPTFETKYLKNYLTEMGHELQVRSQLTKGKYKFEYVHSERKPIYRLTKENLKEFDLLIIDATSYRKLSSNSRSSLDDSIREAGLGVFVQPDQSLFGIPNKKSFFETSSTKISEIVMDEWPKIKIDVYPYDLATKFLMVPIHQSSEGTSLAVYRSIGKGRVGTTVLRNSFQLILTGRAEIYKELWAKIIGELSNRKSETLVWEPNSVFAVQHQPYDFKLRTNIKDVEVVNGIGGVIPIIQDPDLDYLWNARTYPRQSGWNSISVAGDSASAYDYYVLDSTQWNSLITAKTVEENTRNFNNRSVAEMKTSTRTPINPLWFFVPFVLCIGLLWLEPKFYEN